MGALMVCCPATGSKISLGVDIDSVSFDRTPDFVATVYCATCALDHPWSKADAWIDAADFTPLTPKEIATRVRLPRRVIARSHAVIRARRADLIEHADPSKAAVFDQQFGPGTRAILHVNVSL